MNEPNPPLKYLWQTRHAAAPPTPPPTQRPIRVLVAEDSVVMRNILRNVLTGPRPAAFSDLPPMEICGMAADGLQCLDCVRDLEPDLLLLDIDMPLLGGLAVLDRLRASAPSLPVVICSTLTEHGAAAALDALARGASDYVTKPANQASLAASIANLASQLLPRIAALLRKRPPPAGQPLPRPLPSLQHALLNRAAAAPPDQSPATQQPLAPNHRIPTRTPPVRIVVIGVSTGGPTALERILPLLPADFPVPVVIVQHMPAVFTRVLSQRLRARCSLRVEEAADGAALAPGTIWIAKGDWHAQIIAPARNHIATLALNQDPVENGCRPAVDPLFRSAAQVFGDGVLALVLTGMGSDGLQGSAAVRRAGGAVLAQDEASSAIWGMPRRVAEAGLADRILHLDAIASELDRRSRKLLDPTEQPPQEALHAVLAR